MAESDSKAKSSRAAYSKAYDAANRERIKERKAAYYAAILENPERNKEYFARYYAEHKSEYRSRERRYVDEDRASYNARKAAERRKNPSASRDAMLRWRANNMHVVIHHNGLRRSRKQQATPAWANLSAIKTFYAEAARLSKEVGGVWHVDHIVPLTHPLVCGLHCEFNLRVLPGPENQSKANRFDV